jgi:hypothetical protein
MSWWRWVILAVVGPAGSGPAATGTPPVQDVLARGSLWVDTILHSGEIIGLIAAVVLFTVRSFRTIMMWNRAEAVQSAAQQHDVQQAKDLANEAIATARLLRMEVLEIQRQLAEDIRKAEERLRIQIDTRRR